MKVAIVIQYQRKSVVASNNINPHLICTYSYGGATPDAKNGKMHGYHILRSTSLCFGSHFNSKDTICI